MLLSYPTIASTIENVVHRYLTKEALYYPKKAQRWSFEEWNKKANMLASSMLSAGIQKGDTVSTLLFNTSEFVLLHFASAKIGAVFNPLNYRLSPEDILYILNDSNSKLLLFEETFKPVIEKINHKLKVKLYLYADDHCPQFAHSFYDFMNSGSPNELNTAVTENDPYCMLYTSGTTGRPKGVIHNNRAILDHCMIVAGALGITPLDTGLSAAPMYHAAELHAAYLTRVITGAKTVIQPVFNPKETLKIIEEEKVTTSFLAPIMWYMLLREDIGKYDLSSFRLGLYGASSMSKEMVLKIREVFKVDLIEAYGMTEFGPCVTLLLPHEQVPKAGSAGRAMLNHEVRIAKYDPSADKPSDPDDILPPGETGEILIRGVGMMSGYHNHPELTKQKLFKGWYHSGDIGFLDGDGYLWWVDRADDIINSGGENISSREIEDLLLKHPGVLEAAVVGSKDEKWGHVVTCFAVVKEGTGEKELDAFLRNSGLASFKCPKKYHFLTELPKTPSGKIKKFELKKNM